MVFFNMIYRVLFLVIFFSLSVSNTAWSQKLHGLAMHGTPKYESNFSYLNYVNPDALKGGTLKFGVYGSYDNLNRVAFKGSKAAGLGYINDTLMRRVWDEAFTLYGLIAEFAEMPDDVHVPVEDHYETLERRARESRAWEYSKRGRKSKKRKR